MMVHIINSISPSNGAKTLLEYSARVDNVIDLYDLCKLQDFELNRVVEWIHYFV